MNPGTKGDLNVSSDWMTPGPRYVDLYLILSLSAPQPYAHGNWQKLVRKIGRESYYRDAESCHKILVQVP